MRLAAILPGSARLMLWCVSLSGALGSKAHAQSMTCVQPVDKAGKCTTTLSDANAKVLLSVRLLDHTSAPIANHAIVILSGGPPGVIVASTQTNADGIATAEYLESGMPTSRTIVFTTNVLMHGAVAATPLTVPFTISPKPSSKGYTLVPIGKGPNAWYIERQLPDSIGIRVSGPTTKDACNATAVKFRAFGEASSTAPDSSFGSWNANSNECAMWGRWKLGKEVGEQTMRVELAGEPVTQTTLHAIARALPRIMAGLAITYGPGYDIVGKTDVAVGRVTRKFPTDSLEVAFDSVVTVKENKRASNFRFAPILGVDWAPVLRWPNLRTIIATNPNNAKNEWYVGASILQPVFGNHRESVPVDVQLALNLMRRERVVNFGDCKGIPTACKTDLDDLKITGVSIMLSIDGTTLLKDLVTAFPLK